jgi:hypothetical protein
MDEWINTNESNETIASNCINKPKTDEWMNILSHQSISWIDRNELINEWPNEIEWLVNWMKQTNEKRMNYWMNVDQWIETPIGTNQWIKQITAWLHMTKWIDQLVKQSINQSNETSHTQTNQTNEINQSVNQRMKQSMNQKNKRIKRTHLMNRIN